jgi:cytochrome b6
MKKDAAFALRRSATLISVSILTLTLVAGFTGILLAFYYQPSAGNAYQSLTLLTTQVPFGWLIRRVHDVAGNGVIGLALIQMVVMFLGERFRRSWVIAWISGIVFILAAIGLGWTAMLLDWSQLGFWRLRVELGIIEAVPLVGAQVRNILTGGGAITSVTLAHLYTLHSYVLSLGAVVLAIAHLAGLLLQEREMARAIATAPAEALVASPVAQPGIPQPEMSSGTGATA